MKIFMVSSQNRYLQFAACAVLVMLNCHMRRCLLCAVFKKKQEVISYVRTVSLQPYYNTELRIQKKERKEKK